jgi:hypothetical protein
VSQLQGRARGDSESCTALQLHGWWWWWWQVVWSVRLFLLGAQSNDWRNGGLFVCGVVEMSRVGWPSWRNRFEGLSEEGTKAAAQTGQLGSISSVEGVLAVQVELRTC